jgi:hypothetical protein
MSRKKKKLSPGDQAQKEREALAAPVRTDGKGEHPAIQALMSPEFEKMSNLDASQIALMLQEIVRGQNSLLAQNSSQIAMIRERQDKTDQDTSDRFDQQNKFIQEVLDRAEDLKRTGMAHDKLVAEGAAQFKAARESAAATLVMKNMEFARSLAAQPKLKVVSAGQLITTMEHGQQVVKIIPEEVRIKDKRWVLPIGELVEVPESVAAILTQRKASQKETAQRQQLLSKNMESTNLAEAWNAIDGSKTETMPL